ncbi:MAG: protein-disulfide reductase DsbD [Afipia felis]|nr:protein-disulfide reductase DsbD [Afipia felis]
MLSRYIWSAFIAIFVSVGMASSQASGQVASTTAPPLPIDRAFALTATRQDDGHIKLNWKIAPGYYLYQERFTFRQNSSDLAAPELQGNGQTKDDPTFGVTTVFHDHATATLPIASTAPGPLEVRYQGCQDKGVCYPPLVRHVDAATLAVTDPDERGQATLTKEWSAPPAAAPTGKTSAGGIVLAADGGGMISKLLQDGGILTVLASFLLFGFLLAFTPCVFPMYPILAGAIARQGETVTPLRGFTLSLAYVMAMATAFGLLGVAAAWSGQNLQMALQSPLAIGAVSVLFVVLALSMFGLFELQLPSAWVSAIGDLGQGNRGSLASAALLGFTSALVVGPCVTAPLAGALIYIAQTGNVAIGAVSLFALGLGKGIPLVTFGTLGPTALPKAGAWMTRVRQAFGFIFIATAVWMFSRLLPAEATLALWSLFAIGLAVWLGAFDTLTEEVSGRKRVAKTAGLAVALYGVFLAVGAASGAGDPFRPLGNLLSQANGTVSSAKRVSFRDVSNPDDLKAEMAASDGKPSLLYVTADWCITCGVIDRSVLPDPGVQSRLAGFNLLKLDVSDNSPLQHEMMQSLQVAGPPTMIFVDAAGRESSGTRLVGDVTKASLEAAAAKLEAAQ